MSATPPRTRRTRSRPSGDGREYRVDELSTVDARSLEDLLNAHARLGQRLDSIHFAMRESSRRPSMAFLVFEAARGAARRSADLAGAREAGPPAPAPRDPAEALRRLRELAGEEDP